jgi:electron transfer flavoprotein beta subunit
VNIVVCLKAVPTNGKMPAPAGDGISVVTEGDLFLNESDDYALEQALLLKRSLNCKVTAVTLGSIKSQDILHVAIAKGADDALRVDADEFDPNVAAFLLARAVQTLNADLILTGVESSDGMASQVPIALGAQLGIAYVYAVTKVFLDSADGPLTVTRELGGGRHQTLEIALPALLCLQSGTVPLTYTPVVKLIHARRRGIPTLNPDALGITAEDINKRRRAKVLDIRPVDKSSATQWLSGSAQELARQIMDKISKAR